MENVVNLEQLDYRDQLIKEYIDSHSGGGSDFMDIAIAVRRTEDNGEDVQHMYVGVPEGTDVTDLDIKFLRHSKVYNRDKNASKHDQWDKSKYNGFHEIWAIPQKDKIPLINIVFKDKTNIDFTKAGYDFYEITGKIDDTIYDSMLEYINTDESTGYYNENVGHITFGYMLSHKRGGIVLTKNGNKMTNLALFRAVWSETFETYRITTSYGM